jgi:membrane associated rhomboid family serine protease
VKRWNAGAGNIAAIGLIVANVAIFIVGAIVDHGAGLSGRGGGQFTENMGLHEFFIRRNDWWRLVTSGFLHFGFLHLGMNMFALWNLGQAIEPVVGRVRFLLLYFASLLAGSFGVIALQYAGYQKDGLTGGASGAVFGLLGAIAIAYHQRGMSIMRSGLGASLLINLVLTVSLGLSFGGHLGGFIGGLICGHFLMSTQRGRATSQLATLVPLIVIGVSFVGSILIARM